MFNIGNPPTSIGKVFVLWMCVVTFAPVAIAQTQPEDQPTMMERKLLQTRIVHAQNTDKLIMGIGQAFLDLQFYTFSGPGIASPLYPAYVESFKKGEAQVSFEGSTVRCPRHVSAPDYACNESIKIDLSPLKDDKYMIKLVVHANGAESADPLLYRRYFEAISKSLFLEKQNMELEAPPQL